ncbi:helix-turn-helix transcriptional regulator [Siculibacillus lacustris]|uniref:helix-turn-helix transcriptional regulator n=1 Tax=Siculibacillus lacustris TaxID=1549641 RepID=UPI001D18A411|nr:helix-turn-helix domain-containing protein [Siculibacillus lacustris]
MLIDEKDAAGRLGLSPRTLQAWRVSGGGPIYRKIGRRVAYAVEDLAVFVNAGVRTNTSEGVR